MCPVFVGDEGEAPLGSCRRAMPKSSTLRTPSRVRNGFSVAYLSVHRDPWVQHFHRDTMTVAVRASIHGGHPADAEQLIETVLAVEARSESSRRSGRRFVHP
jgi:hypothetical protein